MDTAAIFSLVKVTIKFSPFAFIKKIKYFNSKKILEIFCENLNLL